MTHYQEKDHPSNHRGGKKTSGKVDFVLVVPYQEIATFGVRSIHSYLRHRGYNVITVYFKRRSQENSNPTDREVSLLVDFINDVAPILVGFSVISPFNNISRMLTKRVRECGKAPIVWGGVHPTLCPENCIDIADILCIGEGEEPLCLIIDALRENDSIDTGMPNCWIKTGDGVIKNETTYLCKNLDSLPYPDLSGKNVFFINDGRIKEEDPYITYIKERNIYDFKAFRGCPFACTYCGNKAIVDSYGKSGGYTRKKSVNRLIAELKYAIEMLPNIKTVRSYDEVFISSDKFTKEFSEKYKNEIGLPFTCDLNLMALTDKNISQLARAGLTSVSTGIEAFSEEIRSQVYKRKMNNKLIIEKSRILEKYKIFTIYDFILDNPMESAVDMERCFWDLVVFLPRPCVFNKYSLSHLPKTELTYRFLKEGRITEDDIVGISDKGLFQWKVTPARKRSKEILFWISVYDLFCIQIKFSGRSFMMPLFAIKFIARVYSYFLAKLVHKLASIVAG